MAWRIELSPEASADLDAAEEHFFGAALAFGNGTEDASEMAAARIRPTIAAIEALADTPYIGTRHDNILPGLRHVTKARATLWFLAETGGERLRILGVFHHGQDHIGRMLARLTGKSGA